jgi:hypothetical protein
MVNDRKLSEIINTEHENVKYLPGHKLPENVVAVTDVLETCHDADMLIFVVPHQFMKNMCKPLIGKFFTFSFDYGRLMKFFNSLLFYSLNERKSEEQRFWSVTVQGLVVIHFIRNRNILSNYIFEGFLHKSKR